MGRAVFPYELTDPDFSWLISSYQENCPQNVCFECGCLPVVFFVESDHNSEIEGEHIGHNQNPPKSDASNETIKG